MELVDQSTQESQFEMEMIESVDVHTSDELVAFSLYYIIKMKFEPELGQVVADITLVEVHYN